MIVHKPSPKDFWQIYDIIYEEGDVVPDGIDLEKELAAALDANIWAEIEVETGNTKEQLDNKLIAEIIKANKM